MRERVECFEQFVDKANFFFTGDLDYSKVELIPKGKTASDMKLVFSGLVEKLDDLYTWDHEKIHQLMNLHMGEISFKAKDYFMPVRLAVTGRKDSPPLAETMAVLGREIVRHRLRAVLKEPGLQEA